MSQENVEVVKSLLAAFADRDLDAAASLLHREIEIRPAIVGGTEGVVYPGQDGNRQFWADINPNRKKFRIKPRSSAIGAGKSSCRDEPSLSLRGRHHAR